MSLYLRSVPYCPNAFACSEFTISETPDTAVDSKVRHAESLRVKATCGFGAGSSLCGKAGQGSWQQSATSAADLAADLAALVSKIRFSRSHCR